MDQNYSYELGYTELIKKVYDEDGELFLGTYLEIPEAKTYARNRDELEKRMQEVLELSLEVRKSKGKELGLR